MPHFYYYVPCKKYSQATIKDAGIEYAFENMPSTGLDIQNGPDGGSGVVIRSGSEPFQFNRDKMEWQRSVSGKFYLGWEKDNLPTPEDLDRKISDLLNKYPLEHNRYNWWTPVAREWPGDFVLPMVRKIDDEGNLIKQVDRQFDDLRIAADLIWDYAEGKQKITDMQEFASCVTCLSTFYRVCAEEVSALEILTVKNISIILYSLIDFISWPQNGE
jgi:hypothetical protein